MGEIRNRFNSRVIFTYEGELRKADLWGIDLRDADLWGVDLQGVNLRGANLQGTDLRGAKNIPQHYIDTCHEDFVKTVNLLKQNGEVKYLRECLMKGKINGIQYNGECACLIGSIANFQKKDIFDICYPKYNHGLQNPAEQWFAQIRTGDTPRNNFFAQKALEWCDELLK